MGCWQVSLSLFDRSFCKLEISKQGFSLVFFSILFCGFQLILQQKQERLMNCNQGFLILVLKDIRLRYNEGTIGKHYSSLTQRHYIITSLSNSCNLSSRLFHRFFQLGAEKCGINLDWIKIFLQQPINSMVGEGELRNAQWEAEKCIN